MTPKEKAEELIYKFRLSPILRDSYTRAMINTSIDEMIEFFKRDGFLMAYPEIALPEIDFLNEVKEEIDRILGK